jgi:hypothetical protein
LRLTIGGEADGGAVCADFARDGGCDFAQQADAILNCATIIVVTEIGIVAQELIEQIAIGAVDLDPVETGGHRVTRGVYVVADQARNFVESQRAGLDIILLAFDRVGITRRFRGGRGDRLRAAQKVRMDKAAHMPQLQDDTAIGLMNRIGNGLPCLDLLGRPDTGGSGPPRSLLTDAGRLGDNQACTSALRIIFGLERADRHMHALASPTRQRGHQDTVRGVDRAQSDGIEKAGRHRGMLSLGAFSNRNMRIPVSNCNGGL